MAEGVRWVSREGIKAASATKSGNLHIVFCVKVQHYKWRGRKGSEMVERAPHTNGHFRELSDKEGLELFDGAARYYLDTSGTEFLEKLEAGEFANSEDDPDVSEVLALVPFARRALAR